VNVNPDIAVTLDADKWSIDKEFYTSNQDLHILGKSYLENMYAL